MFKIKQLMTQMLFATMEFGAAERNYFVIKNIQILIDIGDFSHTLLDNKSHENYFIHISLNNNFVFCRENFQARQYYYDYFPVLKRNSGFSRGYRVLLINFFLSITYNRKSHFRRIYQPSGKRVIYGYDYLYTSFYIYFITFYIFQDNKTNLDVMTSKTSEDRCP